MNRTDELALKALELYRTGEYTHPTLAIKLNRSKSSMPQLILRGLRVERRIEYLKNSAIHDPKVIKQKRKTIEARNLHESLLNMRAIALAHRSVTAAINPAPKIED
jgi:hypothetical protein